MKLKKILIGSLGVLSLGTALVLTSCDTSDYKAMYEEQKAKVEEVSKENADLKEENTDLKEENTGLKATVEKSNSGAYETQIEGLQTQVETLTNKYSELAQSYKTANETIVNLNLDKTNLTSEKSLLEANIVTLNGTLTSVNEELEAKKTALATLQASFDSYKSDVNALTAQAQGVLADNGITEYNDVIDGLNKLITKFTQEYNALSSNATSFYNSIVEFITSNNLDDEVTDAEEALANLNALLSNYNTQTQDILTFTTSLKSMFDEYNLQISGSSEGISSSSSESGVSGGSSEGTSSSSSESGVSGGSSEGESSGHGSNTSSTFKAFNLTYYLTGLNALTNYITNLNSTIASLENNVASLENDVNTITAEKNQAISENSSLKTEIGNLRNDIKYLYNCETITDNLAEKSPNYYYADVYNEYYAFKAIIKQNFESFVYKDGNNKLTVDLTLFEDYVNNVCSYHEGSYITQGISVLRYSVKNGHEDDSGDSTTWNNFTDFNNTGWTIGVKVDSNEVKFYDYTIYNPAKIVLEGYSADDLKNVTIYLPFCNNYIDSEGYTSEDYNYFLMTLTFNLIEQN
jgi:predicted nuclease with TOPRIM domain